MGIDYGEKRIGLAVSDYSGSFARELKIVSPAVFFDELDALLGELEIEKIVIGWPLNMSGERTAKTEEVESFKKKVEQVVTVSVELMDERLSSKMAASIIGSEERIDSMAAQIILQNYLDKQKNN